MHQLLELYVLIAVRYLVLQSHLRLFELVNWLALHQNTRRTLTDEGRLFIIGQPRVTWSIQWEDGEADAVDLLRFLSLGFNSGPTTFNFLFILFLSGGSCCLWRIFRFTDEDELSDSMKVLVLELAVEEHEFVDFVVNGPPFLRGGI